MKLLQAATVCLATLLLVLHAVVGNYNVSLRISSYSNPSHRHANGRCCDFAWWFRCGHCDNYFVVCVWSDCQHTGEVGDSDKLTFGSSVGRLPNPITFDVPGRWNGTLLVVVDVFDNDNDFFPFINEDEFVDQFILTSVNESPASFRGRHDRGTITVSLTVSCSQDYYGEACDVYCRANTTHTCGPDGSWVCVDGWTGDTCDTCVPHPNCSATGGYCEEPGECLCREGSAGYWCSDIVTTPSPTVTPLTTSPQPTLTPTSNMTAEPPSGTGTPDVTPDVTTGTPDVTTGMPLPEAQPHSDGGGGTDMGAVIGGVVVGVVILVAIIAVLVLACLCQLYRRRKGDLRHQLTEDDTNSLVQPLVGENPMYMEHHMGSHVLQDTPNYHQFSNPIYQDTSPTEPPDSEARLTARRHTASNTYSYPRVCSHLVSSVYLPGDESPLSSSLSGTPNHHPLPDGVTETSEPHYEFCNGNVHSDLQSSSNGDITNGGERVARRTQRPAGTGQSRHSVPNTTTAADNRETRPLSAQYFWLPRNS